jgi:hypothetical protein
MPVALKQQQPTVFPAESAILCPAVATFNLASLATLISQTSINRHDQIVFSINGSEL